ncbi:hypothetical protein [Achromobacter insolitus]|uniref:hypothetical protein n=1 Tax=Achromobacter insolitus TaxID=217204 RepID=UPI00174BB6ED|nr:hypothetical protein [Achromobacter insolitus]
MPKEIKDRPKQSLSAIPRALSVRFEIETACRDAKQESVHINGSSWVVDSRAASRIQQHLKLR